MINKIPSNYSINISIPFGDSVAEEFTIIATKLNEIIDNQNKLEERISRLEKGYHIRVTI